MRALVLERALSAGREQMRVLIVEDDPWVRNTLYMLLASLRCDAEIAHTLRQALNMLWEERFNAVVVDLRCTPRPPDRSLSAIRDICPTLVGRVLVIVAESADPEVLKTLDRNVLRLVHKERLGEELCSALQAALGLASPAVLPLKSWCRLEPEPG